MTESPTLLLSTAYFAPIQYFSRFLFTDNIVIEQFENYSKQTYRNRCKILGANGVLPLVIPVKKPNGTKTLTRDILIDYDTKWQKNHKQSIISSYKNAPFFEYYFDDFLFVFNSKYSNLLELNNKITRLIIGLLDLNTNISLSSEFTKPSTNDLRNIIHPKKNIEADDNFIIEKYTQVFQEKYNYIPNLSILDLIFNLGPEATLYLKSCIKKAD